MKEKQDLSHLIVGWAALMDHFGVGAQVLARWMTLNKFPKFEFVTIDRRWEKAWRKEDVLHWTKENQNLFKRKRDINAGEDTIVQLPVGGRGPQIFEPVMSKTRQHGAIRF